MSFEIPLQENEQLIFQAGLQKSRRAMSLGVTDRAVFIARELWLKLDTHYMHRIVFEEIDEVRLVRETGALFKATAWFFIILGGVLTLFAFIGAQLSPNGAQNGSAGSFGAVVILAVGILMLTGKRRILIIRTHEGGKKFRWKPHVLDNANEVKSLQESFLSACRYIGVRTRRLDLITEDEVRRFWSWFVLRASKGSLDETSLKERLKKLCDDVHFETVATAASNELILSANGVRDIVPVVEEILSGAPKIPNWTFTAFRKRKPITEISEGISFDLTGIYFIPYTSGFDLKIVIFSNWPDDEFDAEAFKNMLIELIGEYDFAMNLTGYYLEHMEAVGDERDLIPITELPAVMDEFHTLS